MTHAIEDMRLAYDDFNRRLFDDRLPPRSGPRRTELSVEDLDGCVACCGARQYGFHIRFNRAHFGRDLAEDLSTLAHEMAHADVWRDSHGGHDPVWRAWMSALGFETDEAGRETPVEGGRFALARDAWMKSRRGRRQTEPRPVQAAASSNPALIGVNAFLLTFIAFGLAVIVMLAGGADGGGGRRDHRWYGDDRYSYGYDRGGYWRDDEDRW